MQLTDHPSVVFPRSGGRRSTSSRITSSCSSMHAELEAATDYQLIAAINAEYLTEDDTEDLAA